MANGNMLTEDEIAQAIDFVVRMTQVGRESRPYSDPEFEYAYGKGFDDAVRLIKRSFILALAGQRPDTPLDVET